MIVFYRLKHLDFMDNGRIDDNSLVEYETVICKDIFYDYAASLKPAAKAWAERSAMLSAIKATAPKRKASRKSV